MPLSAAVGGEKSMRVKGLLWCVWVCVLLVVTACAAPLPEGESGSVAMIPFASEEYGIRGNAPLEGWSDRAVLIQESFPGTMDEFVAVLVEKTDLVQLPRSTGAYKGAYLAWDLYTFGTQIVDAGPGVFKVDLALAQGKGEAKYYMVLLVAQSMGYVANEEKYETVFEHALYAFEPLE
jgi:hypothetical protein